MTARDTDRPEAPPPAPLQLLGQSGAPVCIDDSCLLPPARQAVDDTAEGAGRS
jgi:hypothetical protein